MFLTMKAKLKKTKQLSKAEVGATVVLARKEKDWSQAYVCKKVKMSKPSLINIEKGRRFPKYDKMVSLMRLLDLKIAVPQTR